MRHLVIGQRQKAPNFSAFHWSPHGWLITIGQHFVTTRVVHLPKRTETSLITESDQSRANHQLLQLCTVRTAWSDSDQAVRAVHSCKSWFGLYSALQHWYNFLSKRNFGFQLVGDSYGIFFICKCHTMLKFSVLVLITSIHSMDISFKLTWNRGDSYDVIKVKKKN